MANDMRIFSKKALQFHHPEDATIPPVSVEMQNFANVPEWVAESKMFKLASIDGDVDVIQSKQDEITAENGGSPNKRGNKNTNNDNGGETTTPE